MVATLKNDPTLLTQRSLKDTSKKLLRTKFESNPINNIARYVYAIRRGEHITQSANKIFGMTLKAYIEFRTLCLLHKTIVTNEPPYIFEKLQFSQTSRAKAITPKRYNYLNSERQFFIYAVRLWNNLSVNLKRVSSVQQFKRKLRVEIFM